MALNEDILEMVEREQSHAAHRALRALIIQPGALGDCVTTLPLAHVLLESLGVGGVDILGHMDTLSVFPGRSCVHSVRSLDTVPVHRLFVRFDKLDLQDHDPLIYAFSDYTWILTFLGEPDSNFERNLVYTVHCSHGAEIATLALKPPLDYPRHITDYYLEQFAEQTPTLETTPRFDLHRQILHPTPTDRRQGHQLLQQAGVETERPVVAIHPGSGGQAKCWHLDNFLAVAKVLQQQGNSVVFLVGPVEQERWTYDTFTQLKQNAPLLAELPLAQTLAVLSNAAAVVANDSGISHLAAGLGQNTLVVFGPTAPHLYHPIGPRIPTVSDPSQDYERRASTDVQEQVISALQSLLEYAD